MKKIIYTIFICSLIIVGVMCGGKNSTEPEPAGWAAINSGLDSKTIQCIAPAGSDQILYAGTLTGVYRTDNGGADWSARNTGLISLDAKSIAVYATNANLVFCGTWGKGVFKSSNGGDSWTQVWDNNRDPRVHAVAIGGNGFLWAATEGGLLKSADQGTTWEIANHSDGVMSVAIHPANQREIYIGVRYNGNFKSTDNGATWSEINSGIYGDSESAEGILAGNSFVFDQTNASIIYMSTGTVDVYKSTNSGLTWDQNPKDKSDYKIVCLAVDPDNPRNIWAASKSFGMLFSSDAGIKWLTMNDGLPQNVEMKNVVFTNGSKPIVYAGTAGQGIFKYSE